MSYTFTEMEWLNKLIMNQALRGYTDCTGPITVNWNTFDNYVFALIQEYTGKWNYRIFVCKDMFYYERNIILCPSHVIDNPQYVYDYYCDIYGNDRNVLEFIKGDWLEDMHNIVIEAEE